MNAVLAEIERAGDLQAAVDLLYDRFDHYSWVGIYLVEGDDLVLGAWKGPQACRIALETVMQNPLIEVNQFSRLQHVGVMQATLRLMGVRSARRRRGPMVAAHTARSVAAALVIGRPEAATLPDRLLLAFPAVLKVACICRTVTASLDHGIAD